MLTVLAWRATNAIHRATDALCRVPEILDARLAAESRNLRQAVVQEVAATRTELLVRLDRLVSILDQRTFQAISTVESETTATRIQVLTQMELARKEVTALREDMSVVLTGLDDLVAHSDYAVRVMTPQALGLTAAAKVAAGETAQAMRSIKQETPAIVANVRQTTANVATVTKPSRWYVRLARYGLPVLAGWLLGNLD